MIQLQIRWEDANVRKMLAGFPSVTRDEMRTAMRALLKAELDEVNRLSEKRIADPRGAFRGANYIQLTGNASSVGGKVANRSPHAFYVEYGRKPGKRPPVAALRGWAGRVLGDENAAFALAKAIGLRGTQGKFIYRDAGKGTASRAALAASRIPRRIVTRVVT